MITKTYYVCSFCGKSSPDEEKVKACEEKHVTIGGDYHAIEQKFNRSGSFTRYPEELIFTLKDGTKLGYKNAWITEVEKCQ